MAEKDTKISANMGNVVQLLNENELKSEMGEAFASFMINPAVTWAKFILTDDRKNANGERIPKDEFKNILLSGIHMPVKMAIGEISQGHPGTKPLGTITHLKEVTTADGTNAIVALAALWSQERPADIEFIKQRIAENKSVDVSWEILYEDASFNAEHNSMDLFGTVLKAATVVGNPAYEGRTPFLSIAAKKKSEAVSENSSDEAPIEDSHNLAEDNLNEIEQLKADMAEVQTKLDEALALIEANKTTLAERDAEIERLSGENSTKETELASLREFKETAEAESAKKQKLASIKSKFVEAGLEKDDEYFAENSEKLAAMSDDQLDFMIQELKVFSEAAKTASASSKKTTKVPALINTEDGEVSIHDLAQHLRNRGTK